MITFGYCIAYVENVEQSLEFFEKAFSMKRRFLHETHTYGELDTGQTVLAFANFSMADGHFPNGYVRADNPIPLGMEIALVTDDVTAAHTAALAAGGVEVSKPSQKPWGQVVSYVRAPNGVLVELCSPMG